MPDPQQKLVKVGDDVVAFPLALEDQHVANAIKLFRAKKKQIPNADYAEPGPYKTDLTPEKETQFQNWVKANRVPWQDTPTADYDMRGYWNAMVSGNKNAKQAFNKNDKRMHFPDTWKTPYHKSFSNESRYALPNAPKWNNKDQLVDSNGKVVFDERAAQQAIQPVQPIKSPFAGRTTEESEKARQLKPAQSLSSAIPSLPNWATKPISEPGDTTPLEKFNTQQTEQFRASHPNIGAVEKGAGQFAEGMRSPVNLALIASAPESKLLSAYFAIQALRGSYRDARAAEEAYRKGNNQEAIQYATQAGLGAATAGLAGAHAYNGLPEGVRSRLANEDGSVGPQEGGSERRANQELRKRIDEMTPDEMRKILKTSDVVDLPNKRSFQEDQHFSPMPFVARSDADGLKAFNDKFGYEKGDELLRAKAEALKEAGLNAYHEKGDEFLYRGNSEKEIQDRLEKAREIFRNKVFDVTLDDGVHVKLKGADFSYGTGKSLKEAEAQQHAHKEAREKAGQRSRGELRGFTEVGPQASGKNPSSPQSSPSTSLAKIESRTYEQVQKDIDKAEGELEKSGQQVTKLYFPEHADVLSKAEGWKPMPDNLVKLYAERDAIGSGQLKQSLGQITENLKSAGIKDDAEIRHVLEYYALDPNRTDAAKQYMAAEHTQKMVDQPVKRQLEQAYIALASERNIPMDDADDLWRDKKTTKDAIAAVKAIHSYFYPGAELDIKGNLPEPKPLDEVKKKAALTNTNNVRVKDPNGMIHVFPNEAQASAFRKAAGIE